MRVETVSNQSFTAGKVYLKQVAENTVLKKNVLEKIAESNNVDLWISKSKESIFLPTNDMYTVTVRKDLNVPPYIKHGVAIALPKKVDDTKTVTEKVFGAIFQAIENMKNKI